MSVMGKEIKGPVWMQFSIAVIGLTSTAMLFEFLQELIFRHPDWHHGAFMTLCGMLVMAVSPIFTMAVQGKHDEIRKVFAPPVSCQLWKCVGITGSLIERMFADKMGELCPPHRRPSTTAIVRHRSAILHQLSSQGSSVS